MGFGKSGKGMEQREHHAGNCQADTEFHKDDAIMLALGGVIGQHVVVQKQPVQHHAGNTDRAIDNHPASQHRQIGPARHQTPSGLQPEDQRVKNESGSDNHAGLKPAARAIIPMKLHIEAEDDDRREQDFGGHPQDGVVTHRHPPSLRSCQHPGHGGAMLYGSCRPAAPAHQDQR